MSLVSNKHVFRFFPGLGAWQRIMLTQSQELLKSPAGPVGEAEYREAQVRFVATFYLEMSCFNYLTW